MQDEQKHGETEYSHIVNVAKLPAKGQFVKFSPNDAQRAALAADLDVAAIDALKAELTLKKWHRDGVRVVGALNAEVQQACVITLEPVAETVDAEIDALFVPETSKLAKPQVSADSQEIIIDADGGDAPETFEPPYLDVGSVVAEFLALEIDPYPKAPDADEVAANLVQDEARDADDARENPFAKLAKLRDKL